MKIKLLIILLFALNLSGCGFKLRTQATIPPQLGLIYIQEQVPPNTFAHYLRNRLLLAGAKFTSTPNQASTTLQLSTPKLKQTRLNSNIDIQTRLYTLTYSVSVNIATSHNKNQTHIKTFNTSHNLVVSADSTLDATGQLDTAIEEMQNEIVNKVLDYLRAQQFSQ